MNISIVEDDTEVLLRVQLGDVGVDIPLSRLAEMPAVRAAVWQSRCKTCVHWGYRDKYDAKRWADRVVRDCNCPKMTTGDGPELDEYEESSKAVQPDADGCHIGYPVASLMTGPDFGCVHWTAKKGERMGGR